MIIVALMTIHFLLLIYLCLIEGVKYFDGEGNFSKLEKAMDIVTLMTNNFLSYNIFVINEHMFAQFGSSYIGILVNKKMSVAKPSVNSL